MQSQTVTINGDPCTAVSTPIGGRNFTCTVPAGLGSNRDVTVTRTQPPTDTVTVSTLFSYQRMSSRFSLHYLIIRHRIFLPTVSVSSGHQRVIIHWCAHQLATGRQLGDLLPWLPPASHQRVHRQVRPVSYAES